MSGNRSYFEKFFIPCSSGSIASCNVRKKHKHCKLCGKAFDTPFHCNRHFRQSHASRAVSFGGQLCYPCKQKHGPTDTSVRAHFHCPVCTKTILNRSEFIKHLNKHGNGESEEDDEHDGRLEDHPGAQPDGQEHPDVQPDGQKHPSDEPDGQKHPGVQSDGQEHSDVRHKEENYEKQDEKRCSTDDQPSDTDEREDNDEEAPEMDKSHRGEQVKKMCPLCNKSMHPKSLARHFREIHKT